MNSSFLTVLFIHLYCLTLLIIPFIICTGSSEILCISSERETLLNLKNHLNDTSNRLSSWNATLNTNCCEWKGVVCSNVTAHVVELHLNISPPSDDYDNVGYEAYQRSRFSGEINPCLVDLRYLNYLDLSGNNFGGMQIPTFLGEITSLTYLNLSYAGFSAKIPHQIGNLSNLLYLALRSDYYVYSLQLSEEIPYQIGNLTKLVHLDIGSDYRYQLSLFSRNIHWLSGLSSLQYLDLGFVNLSKSFDWLQVTQKIPSLVELHLSSCPLRGYNQPSTVNFSSLVTLDLSYSYALGNSSFPKWICGLTNLVSLQLIENNIEGPIPDGLQNLTLLENLDLSDNLFFSSIPNWLCSLHHLKFLNLGYNNLHGTIPGMLGNMTSLVGLDLSRNQFEGKIPTSLGNLCNLRELSFSYPKLNQQVNEILQILTPCVSHGLKALYIGSSKLSGPLTDQIGVFKNLIQLGFYSNSIHGAVPRSLEKLSSLRYLDLSNNQFNGNPFESIRSLSKLSSLDISNNLFEGVVKEDDLANLTNLSFFLASGNNFSLKVGPNWHPNFQVTELMMNSWNLGPNFPSWIQSQKHLVYLDMSNTGILDSIPTWFWDAFSHASYLDLSSNHLSGPLVQLSVKVFYLDLSNNLFSGSIVELLCKNHDEPKNLEVLNLATNNLSREIPDCWQMWPYLVDINLQSNHFVGNLPQSMGFLAWLESLQLRNNTLSGKFPPILKNSSKLISLDLGENKLLGNIPAWIGERLINLKFLRLRSNKFSNHIPSQICDLKFLQVLDLAENSLSGNIPNCFNHLNALKLQNKSTQPFIYCDAVNNSVVSVVSMLLWLKGRGDEYRNFLGLVTSIDLSDNKLFGEIPREITSLDGLNFLNLSHNRLTGQIPQGIGNMGSLQSIDLSRNQLLGEIPPTISNLSFVSQLNLSYNLLKGKIPIGTQLQTLEASNFVGNNLCGMPLPINCSLDGQIPNDGNNSNENDGHRVNWFLVSMALGFVVGFWVVVAPLFIYKSWRYNYFFFLIMCGLK